MQAILYISPIRLIPILLAVLLAPVVAQAQEDDNPRVENVEAKFAALKTYGEIMGFYLGAGAPDPTVYKHWQGIQRSVAPGTPYFFVSRSGEHEAGKHPNIAVVEMLSRNKDRGRLRSNRLNTSSKPLDTAPPAMDRIVTNIEFTDYDHVGGIQRIGQYLVVPLEGRKDENNPKGKVVFYDVKDPRSPVRLPGEIHVDHDCGVVGIAKIPSDDHYLIALTWGYNLSVEFWRSNGECQQNKAK